jgi:hypothetical protein
MAPERVVAAIEHARTHPEMGGPVVLRRVPPQAWTVAARLDRLTAEQHQAVASIQPHRSAISPEEATVLLAALSARGRDQHYAELRQHYPDQEQALKLAEDLRGLQSGAPGGGAGGDVQPALLGPTRALTASTRATDILLSPATDTHLSFPLTSCCRSTIREALAAVEFVASDVC